MSGKPAMAQTLFFTLSVGVAFGLVAVGGARAQSVDPTSEARVVGFTVDPVRPEFGEVFDLTITFRIGPGVVAFLPETLVPGDAAFSAGAGMWSEAAAPVDSVDIRASYPVMGLMDGQVRLPSLELWTRPVGSGESGGARPASDFEDAGTAIGSDFRRVVIPIGALEIVPLVELDAAGDDLFPRPAADVLGGQYGIWFLPTLGATALAMILLAWVLVSRRRLANQADSEEGEHSARSLALLELDRIRSLGWHTQGLMTEFYDASTGVLRRFSGQEEAQWGIALTSSELIERLRGRWGSSSVEDLGSAVSVAEWVKFGGHRSEAGLAESHWTTIRDWIDGRGES
jgi:hypothetical protein